MILIAHCWVGGGEERLKSFIRVLFCFLAYVFAIFVRKHFEVSTYITPFSLRDETNSQIYHQMIPERKFQNKIQPNEGSGKHVNQGEV